jgi:hypothetical protein
MKTRKAKGSLREKLSAAYLEAFEADFAENGVAAIQQLREKSPEKYSDIAARLIAATEPTLQNDFSTCNSQEDIARKLLHSVGFSEPDDASIQEAVELNNKFIADLEAIKANANGNAASVGESS